MSWKTIIRPKGWLAVGQNKFEVDVQCSNKWSIGEGIVDRFEKNLFAICFCSKTFMISSKEYIYIYILFSGICTKIIEIFREKYCLFDVKCHDKINLNCIMQWTTCGMVDSKKGEIPASSENKLAWRWGSGWKFDLPFWQTFRSMDYELFTTVWNIVKTIVSVGFSNISIKSVTQSKVVRNILVI